MRCLRYVSFLVVRYWVAGQRNAGFCLVWYVIRIDADLGML